MGILRHCNDYEEATKILGVVTEYIELPQEMLTYEIATEMNKSLSQWVVDNTEGTVIWIKEYEFNKIYITFLFQYSEDAIAFKLVWM